MITKRNGCKRGAFTLIELLVVIAIIAVLAAILFPVFGRAREQARKTGCLSNLRQIGTAMGMYTSDFDEGYPNTNDPYLYGGRRFRWPIMPYLGVGQTEKGNAAREANSKSALLRCPSDPTATRFDDTSYSYSACFYHTPAQIDQMRLVDLYPTSPPSAIGCVTQTQAAVTYPAAKILCFEWTNAHDYTEANAPVSPWGTLGADKTPGADRWSGARTVLFADGHARFLQSRRITPTRDDTPDPNLTPGGIGGRDITP